MRTVEWTKVGTIGFGTAAACVWSVVACAGTTVDERSHAESSSGGSRSDGGPTPKDAGSGGQGGGGTGGRGTGGSTGVAGAGSTEPRDAGTISCGSDACEARTARINAWVERQGVPGPEGDLVSCCASGNLCGVEPVNRSLPCIDSTFLDRPTVISVDGGPDVHLNDGCSGIVVQEIITLPGCCRPDGTCGGSTHGLSTADTIPVACVSAAELTELIGDGSGAFPFQIIWPPRQACTY